MTRICLIIIHLALIVSLFGQELTSNRRTDWTNAGSNGIQNPDFPIINFLNYGGVGDGTTPNDFMLDNLIDTYNGAGVIIFFPNGDYLFNQEIRLTKNLILRGESPEYTTLYFDLNGVGNCINVVGNNSSVSSQIMEDAEFNEDTIHLSDASSFEQGNYIHIRENDSEIVFSE